MKQTYIVLFTFVALVFACEPEPKVEKKADQSADSTAVVEESQPQDNPVVVQIGAFKKAKNANSRAAQFSGATIVQEGALKKVFVTAQSEDEVAQIKQQFDGQDLPFRRLDK